MLGVIPQLMMETVGNFKRQGIYIAVAASASSSSFYYSSWMLAYATAANEHVGYQAIRNANGPAAPGGPGLPHLEKVTLTALAFTKSAKLAFLKPENFIRGAYIYGSSIYWFLLLFQFSAACVPKT